MAVLVTCKNDEDPAKNEGKLIQALMVVLVTWENEDPIKIEGTKYIQDFLHYVGHPISSDNGLISQKLLLESELY